MAEIYDDDILLDEETDGSDQNDELYEHFALTVDRGQAMMRIDKYLTVRMEHCSRNRLQTAADNGNILVNGRPVKSNYRVKPLDRISIVMPYPKREVEIIPENIPLDIVYEDNDIIRIKHSLRKYIAPRQNVAQKRALSVSDIISIINLPYLDTPTREGCPCRRDMAKDCFVMSFCLMGMNSVDMYNAKDFDGETLTYERTKTKDRRSDNALIAVKVHPFIRQQIEKYKGKDYLF